MNMLKGDRNYWETYGGGIAFYKPGVKAIWLMFAVLKELLQELSVFIYGIPAVRKKKMQEMYWILKKMPHFNYVFKTVSERAFQNVERQKPLIRIVFMLNHALRICGGREPGMFRLFLETTRLE